jgi:cyclic pyranopterin phosphate synthase
VSARRAAFTHFDRAGGAHMVSVAGKEATERRAVAQADVRMRPAVLAAVRAGRVEKGDVLGVARVAGVQAVKRTAELIPLCHPLALSGVEVSFAYVGRDRLRVAVAVTARDRTGVEMEALTGAAVAALTVYDMCKAADRWMRIEALQLLEKTGGKSGPQRRGGTPRRRRTPRHATRARQTRAGR